MAAAVAELVPTLSGSAFGIAVRLLSLSSHLSGPLVAHPDIFDPLVAQSRHSELLVLDTLDQTEI